MKTLNLKNIFLSFASIILASIICDAQQGKIVLNQDDKITTLMNLRKDMNKNENPSDRYKIQIYSGNRATAEATQLDFKSKFDKLSTTLVFETPNYKIWAGSFRNRLEADRALREIKQHFSAAFIFKPKR